MVSFLQSAKAVHVLEPFTHWIHEATLAERLRISTDDLEGWTKCVREGGSGAVFNNTFKANPEPLWSLPRSSTTFYSIEGVKEQINDTLVALNVLTTLDIPRVITHRSMRLSGDRR
jgi:hypothetical protein